MATFPNSFYRILLLLVTVSFSIYPQQQNIQFDRYSVEEGLSQSSVNFIFQDSRGFMWFCTQDGLNRFDGYTFKIYRHIPGDSTSLSNNYVWCAYEDFRGDIWVGTFGGGLCRLNRSSDTFTRFKPNPENPGNSLNHPSVRSLLAAPAHQLWVATEAGLNMLDLKTGNFTNFKDSPDIPTRLKSHRIYALDTLDSNTLWIGAENSLHKFDVRSLAHLKTYQPDTQSSNSIPQEIISLDYHSPSGQLWIATNNGLSRLDSKTENIHNYFSDGQPGSLSANNVQTVMVDRAANLWIGGMQGSAILPPPYDGKFHYYRHNPDDAFSLSNNFVFSIYENRQGDLWIGTRTGLNHYNPGKNKFPMVTQISNDNQSLSGKNVLAFHVSSKYPDEAWVGTNQGLNLYNFTTGKARRFYHEPANPFSISSSYILDICEDSRGNLWIGTRGGGLNRYDRQSDRFYSYRSNPDDPQTIGSDVVSYIYEDLRGQMWIGTSYSGLNRFDSETGKFHRYPYNSDAPNATRHSHIFALHEDKAGNFWVGTATGGLHILDRATDTFSVYMHSPDDPYSLSNDLILSIFESRSGEVWICTAGRLNRVEAYTDSSRGMIKQRHRFIHYGREDGLPNEVIYGMLEDNQGYYWISTNNGLVKFRLLDDGSRKGKLDIRSFTHEDGLQSDEFNHNAFFQDFRGKMYFGGVGGFNHFHPDSILDDPHVPPVVITDFLINNQSVQISSDSNSPLRRDISLAEDIFLGYQDDVISFEFAALHFARPEKNQYAYMMEGFDEDWNYSGNRRFVTYTNLDPGTYNFRVKASNKDELWNETGTTVRIHIAPPPWRTWWAYLLYVCAAIISLTGFMRYRLYTHEQQLRAEANEKDRIAQARREERREVRKKSAADFHDESGNVITKINLFLELAKRSTSSKSDLGSLREYLSAIEDNTKTLSSNMRDFIWSLDPERDTLYDAMVRLKQFGNSMFEHSEMRFTTRGIEKDLANVNLRMDDRRSIVLIFKEAMNNALKYANGSEVTFIVAQTDRHLAIILKDNGDGFSGEQSHDGYGLKNMQARAKKINGDLQIKSHEGSGTTIVFSKEISQLIHNEQS